MTTNKNLYVRNVPASQQSFFPAGPLAKVFIGEHSQIPGQEPWLGGKEVGKSDIGMCLPKVLHLAVLSSIDPSISP